MERKERGKRERKKGKIRGKKKERRKERQKEKEKGEGLVQRKGRRLGPRRKDGGGVSVVEWSKVEGG